MKWKLMTAAAAALAITWFAPVAAANENQTEIPSADLPHDLMQATPPDADDQVICRSQRLIGSRTQRQRVCLTRRAWRDIADNSRRQEQDRSARETATPCRTGECG